MTNAELIAKIKAEIERLKEINKRTLDGQLKAGCLYALNQVLPFLDTLESEKPINPEDAMKELEEKIALVKQRRTWDGVDVDKYMDEVRGREPEKPMNQDELEDEMDRFFETMPVLEHENIFEVTFQNIARHFAQWGYLRAAEKYNEIEYNRQRAEEEMPLPEDTVLFNKGVEEGKRLIMEEAVEGTYAVTTVGHFAFFLDKPIKDLCFGDKVRVIVCKKED